MFGLVRYDGTEYKTYRYNSLEINSLSNDDVISICEDKEGNLWVGTYNGGLNKLDRHTGIFTRYLSDKNKQNNLSDNTVRTKFQDSKNNIRAGTENGFNKLDEQSGKNISYKNDSLNNESISGNITRSITEDKEGNLWIGTLGEGLNKFEIEKEVFTNYKRDSTDYKSLSDNNVSSLFTDKAGTVWIGTGNGLNKYDEDKMERVCQAVFIFINFLQEFF